MRLRANASGDYLSKSTAGANRPRPGDDLGTGGAAGMCALDASEALVGEFAPNITSPRPRSNPDSRRYVNMRDKVLVAGASGLIGVSAVEAFLDAGWDVIGVSRRKPKLPSGRDFDFVPVDLRDEKAAQARCRRSPTSPTCAYAAIYENADDLVSGWSNDDQIEVNNAMLRNVIEPLVAGKSALKHVSVLQGTKAYGVHLHPIAIPARESDPRDNHRNFFFDQQDYVRDAGAKHGFTYTVLRPQLVTGKIPAP